MFCSKCHTLCSTNNSTCPACGHNLSKKSFNSHPIILVGSILSFISFFIIGYVFMLFINLNPEVQFIKDATLVEYPQQQIGEAFDDFFLVPEWTSFKSDAGEAIVEFTGEALGESLYEPILIQFTLDTSNNTFEITYYERSEQAQSYDDLIALLDLVYN